jgi:NAD-dependent DNA ligase
MNISQLEKQISSANLAYSQNYPILTDTEYDILWQELFHLDPENPVLYHTTNNPHYSNLSMHRYQIYGTQKAFNTEDLRPFFTRFGSDKLILEPKYDGCAAVFYKGQDKAHDKLILDGDGIKGQDVSRHLPGMKLFSDKAIYSGEFIIPWKNWALRFGANPRNTVSGWLQRHKLEEEIGRASV